MNREQLVKELADWRPGAKKWLDFKYGKTNFYITRCKINGEFDVSVAGIILKHMSFETAKDVVEYIFGKGE